MGFFKRLFGKKDDFDLDAPLPGEGLPGETHGRDDLSKDTSLPQDNLHLDEKPLIPEEHPGSSGLPPHLEEPMGSSPDHPLSMKTPATPTTPAGTPQRDLELISSKLDTLKAILTSLDQRTANLEKAAGVEQNKKMPW